MAWGPDAEAYEKKALSEVEQGISWGVCKGSKGVSQGLICVLWSLFSTVLQGFIVFAANGVLCHGLNN